MHYFELQNKIRLPLLPIAAHEKSLPILSRKTFSHTNILQYKQCMAEFPLFRVQSSCKFPAAAIPNFRYFPLEPFREHPTQGFVIHLSGSSFKIIPFQYTSSTSLQTAFLSQNKTSATHNAPNVGSNAPARPDTGYESRQSDRRW